MATTRKRTWTTAKGEVKEAWVVTYTDNRGTRRTKSFARKKDADAFRIGAVVEVQQGIHTPDSQSKTLQVVFDEFAAILERRNRDGARLGAETLLNFKGDMNRHILPGLGAIRVNKLSFEDVMKCADEMSARGLNGRTVKSRLYHLRSTLDFAIRRGYVMSNITIPVMKEMGPTPVARVATFSEEEVKKLLQMAREKKYHGNHRTAAQVELFVNLAVFCGMRKGEICALAWDAIDVDDLTISVTRSYTRTGIIKGPKTKAGIRTVPIPPHVGELFRAWGAAHYRTNEGQFLFYFGHASSPKKITGGDITAAWYDLQRRAGTERKHFHALRHFAASYWIDAGLPVTEVAQLLGHATFDETLQTYAHPLVKRDRQIEVVERMSRRFFLQPASNEPERSIDATCPTQVIEITNS